MVEEVEVQNQLSDDEGSTYPSPASTEATLLYRVSVTPSGRVFITIPTEVRPAYRFGRLALLLRTLGPQLHVVRSGRIKREARGNSLRSGVVCIWKDQDLGF
jgi:hypothetical protein